MKVSPGVQVSIEFTMSLDDKTVVGSNVGGDPVVFTHGEGEISRTIERAVEGMEKGETKQLMVVAAEAFGPVDPEAIRQVDKSRIPKDAHFVGAQLQAEGDDGARARVVEVRDDVVVLDFNHPLAGEDLSFEVKVLDVKSQPAND